MQFVESTPATFFNEMTKQACVKRATYTGGRDNFIAKLSGDLWFRDTVDEWAASRIDTECARLFAWVGQPLLSDSRYLTVYSFADESALWVCAIDRPAGRCAGLRFLCSRRHGVFLVQDSLRRLGAVAVDRVGNSLSLEWPPQNDQAFTWSAPSIHPLQASENYYRHRAIEQELADPANARDAQAEVIQDVFFMSSARTRCFEDGDPPARDPHPLASVRMNHLIDSFYLYRLLVAYRITSSETVSEDQRNALSSQLTAMMHDRSRMSWLGAWLAEKIAEIGRRIGRLNKECDTPSVIFFLKGGRALNYWLGTPGEGENDWDTQVVINPFLPQARWYELFAKVHDLLLRTLTEFQIEFAQLMIDHAEDFHAYTSEIDAAVPVPPSAPDGVSMDADVASEHANCKAELIDIGIPRRDQPAAQEEWHRLTMKDALCVDASGVIYPARDYYLNEYLMMIREAYLPGGNVAKAPKRINRFVKIFVHEPADAGPGIMQRMDALPQSRDTIGQLDDFAEKELLFRIGAQFVEAHNLRLDKDIREQFDAAFAVLVKNPPELPQDLRVDDEMERRMASRVQIAKFLSDWMAPKVQARAAWIAKNGAVFTEHLRQLQTCLERPLEKVGAQMVVAGGFAAYLQSKQLRFESPGMEPLWRILVKLQFPHDGDAHALWETVRLAVERFGNEYGQLHGLMLKVEDARDFDLPAQPDRGSFNFFCNEPAEKPLGYSPLLLKIRLACQDGNVLPPRSWIDGVPVTDLRYQIADYARRAAKIDELSVRHALNRARRAGVLMATQLEIVSDE
ncbi:hypothetical protein ACPPVV_03105 [Rhodanobacter sp. Col0626]|uniref:hypothetical protein n=1 Tax=Rhodanobacter sp. Col0626 TaxID=3415679 RepID=UPI003CF87A5D